jgi:hypothetical protein
MRAVRSERERAWEVEAKEIVMALLHWGFIYTGRGQDPATNVAEIGTSECRCTAIGIERPEQALDVARRLVAEGVQMIELCGGFGPVWTARIIDAIDDAVPIGSVAYGPEAVDRVHAIFASPRTP